ncbi:MAG: hypothetical protein E7638_00995 [Ruminococcaceae bacterium]|nr:hypothetical protein [Oscillospiraceae bacterium]
MTNNYLPTNASDYPKASAARTFMVETANKFADEYAAALGKLGKEDKLQKKLLSIQKAMAEHCAGFAAMAYTGSTWEVQIERRIKMLNQSTDIMTEYAEALAPLSPDEKAAFIQYAHTNWLLHNAFIDQHLRKLSAAAENGQPERALEDKIILGTVYAICREWRAWWQENGTLAFDRWTYEDFPWEAE